LGYHDFEYTFSRGDVFKKYWRTMRTIMMAKEPEYPQAIKT
jgi:hypothetical protein